MTKSVFSKLCNKHGGYVSTTGKGYDVYVVHDTSKHGGDMTGGGIGDLDAMIGGGIGDLDAIVQFFGGRLSPRSFAGGYESVYTGGKKNSELDSFMAYLQGKGDALVAGDIAGAKSILTSNHKNDRNEIEEENDE